MFDSKEKFSYDSKELVKLLGCLFITGIFWILPPFEPITPIGMKVLGTFIGTVLLLSIVDTVWPVFLAFIFLSMSKVLSLNEILGGSLGNWIITFVIASFIMTFALNESGFTSRLTEYYMSRKFVNKSPWMFTFAFFSIAMIVGMFMDQVPATAFFIPFTREMLKKLGYTEDDSYSHILMMGVVFSVNLGGAATPISHPLVILGLGIYEQVTNSSINLITYMIYAIPVSLFLLMLLCLVVRYVIKPDISKLKNINIKNLINRKAAMSLKEKTTVIIFFGTALMWILPGIIKLFLDKNNKIVLFFSNFSITFWAILAVVLLSTIKINKQAIINLKDVLENKFPWGVILFISIGVLLGSAVSNPKVGLSEFIMQKLNPIVKIASPMVLVFIFAFLTVVLTNFASNVTIITVMTGIAVVVALANSSLDPVALSITTTMCGSLAFVLPSSFAPIAMLHSEEYSESSTVIKWGIVMVILTAFITTFIGYPLVARII